MTTIRSIFLAVFITLLTGFSSLHGQGFTTDTYTVLITGDSVADCNNFYFTVWIKSPTGINFRTFQATVWLSKAFLNAPDTSILVTWVPGTSDIGASFNASSIVTPTGGGNPPGTGGDTSILRLNTLASTCPGPLISSTYERIGQLQLTRINGVSGCWGCSNIQNKLGWYQGINAGLKTTFSITDWVTPCGAGTNFTLHIASGTYLANLNNQTPVITAQPVADTICAGSGTAALSVSAISVNPGDAVPTYQWYDNAAPGTPLTNGAPYSGVSSSTLTITNPNVSLNGHCYFAKVAQCNSVTSASTCIMVKPAAPSTPSAVSNSPLCLGSNLNLTSSNGGGGSPTTYSWSGPNGFTSSVQNPTIISVTDADSGTYSVIMTNGCGATSTTTPVNISPGTNTATTQSACNSYIWSVNHQTYTSSGTYVASSTCEIDSLYLTIQSVPTPVVNVADSCGYSTLSTTSAPALLWSTGETSSSITVTAPATYSVTRTFNTCTSSAGIGTAAPGTTPINITVTKDTAICYGDEIQLTATGGNIYIWSPDSAISGNANSSIVIANSKKTITYSVQVTDIKGCTGSATVAMTVYPPPNVRQGHDTLFSNTDPSYIGYQWYDSLTLIPNATDTFYIPNHSGSYYVRVTAANGCIIAVEIYYIMPLGLQSASGNLSGLKVIPNPAKDWLMISGINNANEATLTIYNVLGEAVQEEKLIRSSDLIMNIKTLPAGVYFLQMKSDSGSDVKRFVKE